MYSELGNFIFIFNIILLCLKYFDKYLLHLHLIQLGKSLFCMKGSFIMHSLQRNYKYRQLTVDEDLPLILYINVLYQYRNKTL